MTLALAMMVALSPLQDDAEPVNRFTAETLLRNSLRRKHPGAQGDFRSSSEVLGPIEISQATNRYAASAGWTEYSSAVVVTNVSARTLCLRLRVLARYTYPDTPERNVSFSENEKFATRPRLIKPGQSLIGQHAGSAAKSGITYNIAKGFYAWPAAAGDGNWRVRCTNPPAGLAEWMRRPMENLRSYWF
ncbi:hypothetical protein P1X14_17310 [Sphingomonas sp. AOB5]|uniref:hypothetical protein n=1 Tax=Sphingomonas sp. AOB5 TaxID=3034017 RepID=UPI0023F8381A|nr:hypothetical protein [Sphingomonas sp. AOB5]MDF7777019.1 hypothetical protein [Sphingomonas sp. AOB5]